MAKYTQSMVILLLILLLAACNKPPSAEQILSSVYTEYDQKHACWIANTEEQRYCMKLDSEQKVTTKDSERLYILAAGEAVDGNGEPNGGHVSQGLVGAFVQESRAGKSEIIASNPSIPEGVFGAAPTKWKLVKLGSADYWGWLNTFGDCHQGFCGSFYSILATHGKSIRDISNIVASFDDTGAIDLDACESETSEDGANMPPCQQSSSIGSMLKIDDSNPEAQVYPLQITVSGNDEGTPLTPKTWTFQFDLKQWRYIEPKDYLLSGRDF